jgi:hypothetical protein
MVQVLQISVLFCMPGSRHAYSPFQRIVCTPTVLRVFGPRFCTCLMAGCSSCSSVTPTASKWYAEELTVTFVCSTSRCLLPHWFTGLSSVVAICCYHSTSAVRALSFIIHSVTCLPLLSKYWKVFDTAQRVLLTGVLWAIGAVQFRWGSDVAAGTLSGVHLWAWFMQRWLFGVLLNM